MKRLWRFVWSNTGRILVTIFAVAVCFFYGDRLAAFCAVVAALWAWLGLVDRHIGWLEGMAEVTPALEEGLRIIGDQRKLIEELGAEIAKLTGQDGQQRTNPDVST